MGRERLITIGVIVFILAVAGAIVYFKNFQGSAIQDTPLEAFSRYLGENSVLYVQTGCSACKAQEDLFGANIKYLNIVNCLTDRQACAEIEKTPTWIIDGQKYVGVQSIEKLKELTNYQD